MDQPARGMDTPRRRVRKVVRLGGDRARTALLLGSECPTRMEQFARIGDLSGGHIAGSRTRAGNIMRI